MRKELEGNIYDKYRRQIGEIERCGRIRDKYGNYVGKIEKNGTVRDKYGNYAGRVSSSGDVYDRYGGYRGDEKEKIIKILEERESSSGINWSIPAGGDDIIGGLFAFILLVIFVGSFIGTPIYWFSIGFRIDSSTTHLCVPTIAKIWSHHWKILKVNVSDPQLYKILFIGAGISSILATIASVFSKITGISTIVVIISFNCFYLISNLLELGWLQSPLKQWLVIKLFAIACLVLSMVAILALFVKLAKKIK